MTSPDPHTAWLLQLHSTHDIARDTLLRLLSETPASSLPGIRAQLAAVVLLDGDTRAACGRAALQNAVLSLDGLLADGRI